MTIPANSITSRLRTHLGCGNHTVTLWLLAFVIVGFTSWLTPIVGQSDSYVYAGEIVSAHNNPENLDAYRRLWEFGHLYWRPIGYFLYPLAMAVPDSITFSDTGKVLFILIAVNHLALTVLVAGVLSLSLRWSVNPWIAILLGFCSLWMGGVLYYLKMAMAYPMGLGLLMASLLFQISGLEFKSTKQKWFMAAGGAMAALASLIWFPYILVVPAALFAGTVMRQQIEWRPLAWRVSGFAIVFACLLILGGWLAGIRTISDGIHWFSSSSHGWDQSNRLVRSATGIARLAVDLRDDGVQVKRYLYRDPYNSPSLVSLIFSLGFKLVIFYGLMLSAIFLALRGRQGYWAIGLFLTAFAPVYLFAIILFEPSSPERFVPVVPFLFAMIAMSWNTATTRIDYWAKCLLLLLFVCMLLVNFNAILQNRKIVMSSRMLLGELSKVAAPGDLFMRLIVTDPLLGVVATNPFLPEYRRAQVTGAYLIRPAYSGVTQWRQDFSRLVLRHWETNNDVWLSTSLLAEKPAPNLNWVEGDDPRVTWRDVSSFLQSLETEEVRDGGAIVVKVSRSQGNRDRFAELLAERR